MNIERKPIKFRCPNCNEMEGSAEFIHETIEDGTNMTLKKELWQCQNCLQYFFAEYVLVDLIRLEEEIKENKFN